MHSHLQKDIHAKEYDTFVNKKQTFDSPKCSSSKKRKLFEIDICKSPIVGVTNSPKYKHNSTLQNERLQRLVTMLVKCMLPISMVENSAFVEYIKYLGPSFSMPVRPTVKNSALPQLKVIVQNKIKAILNTIPSLSTSMDAWTDAAARPFNGFIAQGIDYEWNLHTLPIAFDYIDLFFLLFLLK